ncbi:MAG TPA: UDP-N-acetylmuramoyl-L-alanyl-D-glutamate--2,6-diaminopimelate ligase [Thermoanaerobaculia bacterium]|nr:UDP-N-acetylmuramoyl-L-alanyl-D-glutamate--2,6-diaminopimelate ligase [Thermoanaerobaculia bacterium]
MRLSELIAGFPVRRVWPPPAGSAEAAQADPVVTGVEVDSRRVDPGFVFVAVAGERQDARSFARAAAEAGAAAVVAAPGEVPEGWDEVRSAAAPEAAAVPWLETDDPRALAGPLAARAFGHPERELTMAAVTGTNGKSTVAALMAGVLEAAGRPTAIFGTLGYRFREEGVKGDRTTPEAPETLHMLRRWRDHGAEAASMEASSHALALHRLDGLAFDAAVFTNLTQDHFDYHRDFEGYYRAKRHLFDLLKPTGRAVVNLDDPYGRRLVAELGAQLGDRLLTFGRGGRVQAWDAALSEAGIRGVIETPRGSYAFHSRLLGRFNLENLLATAAAAEALELPAAAVREGFARTGPVPGRLEPVERGQPFPVYIDYAHSPGALEAVLRSVAEFSGRRIIVVFGAGGDRDRGKREPMGRIAGQLAELPILSSDNPRGEDPLAIIQMVEEGVKAAGNPEYRIVPDRREAIRRAIAVAGPEHAVVITGKGHEEVQEVGGQKIPFSDREELERALEERFGATAPR